MTKTLMILNDGPYGSERSYNALRLAGALSAREGEEVRVFMMGDAAGCAKAGQKVPEGYYNIQLMLNKVGRNKGQVGGSAALAWMRAALPMRNLRRASPEVLCRN